MKGGFLWYIPRVALLGAFLAAGGCNFADQPQTYNGCRKEWIERYNPKIGFGFNPQPVEIEFFQACMGAKGFQRIHGGNCSDAYAGLSSGCYSRRMPWQ